jgi:O-acetyl-ADP-ribose deacetylase (regulator of RNase III)
MKLLFCDTNEKFCKRILKYKDEFKLDPEKYTIETHSGDVREITETNCAYISPANSLGFMDGGIDLVYMEMFPGVEQVVKDRIRHFNQETALGRPYISIGSALIVQVTEGRYLISAPTMFLPQDVSKTKNAYWAFRAVLQLLDKVNSVMLENEKITTVICPGLCTGYGCMKNKVSARQVLKAIRDHGVKEVLDDSVPDDYYALLCDADPDSQPNLYQNTEFRKIEFKDIQKVK